jgi:hypothetical protein
MDLLSVGITRVTSLGDRVVGGDVRQRNAVMLQPGGAVIRSSR